MSTGKSKETLSGISWLLFIVVIVVLIIIKK